MTMPDLTIHDVSEDEYMQATSKFVVFPPGSQVNAILELDIECGMIDWDNPGRSQKIPVTVTEEGVNKGKEEKVSYGVSKEAIWKGRQLYLAITGEEMPMKDRHPSPNPMATVGKPAVGRWQLMEGRKGGDPEGDIVTYSKLVDILPAGTPKSKVEGLGI